MNGGEDNTMPYRMRCFRYDDSRSVGLGHVGEIFKSMLCLFCFIRLLQLANACRTSIPPNHVHSATCQCPRGHAAAKDSVQNQHIHPSAASRLLPSSLQGSARRAHGPARRCIDRASGMIGMCTLSRMRGRARAKLSRAYSSIARRCFRGRRRVDIGLGGAGLECR
jgi:hypothetical protein